MSRRKDSRGWVALSQHQQHKKVKPKHYCSFWEESKQHGSVFQSRQLFATLKDAPSGQGSTCPSSQKAAPQCRNCDQLPLQLSSALPKWLRQVIWSGKCPPYFEVNGEDFFKSLCFSFFGPVLTYESLKITLIWSRNFSNVFDFLPQKPALFLQGCM